MNKLEKLENEAFNKNLNIQRADLPEKISGIYYNDEANNPLIIINKALNTHLEQSCTLAEELGHHYTSCGNLLTDLETDNTIIRQQELRAKRWAIKKLVTFNNIIKAYNSGSRNLSEMSEYLDVTEDFLKLAFKSYFEIYGPYKKKGNYIIYFNPPGVLKLL